VPGGDLLPGGRSRCGKGWGRRQGGRWRRRCVGDWPFRRSRAGSQCRHDECQPPAVLRSSSRPRHGVNPHSCDG
jgi:hypothetical protein